MTESERRVRERIQEEANELLFHHIEMSESLKEKVRRQAAEMATTAKYEETANGVTRNDGTKDNKARNGAEKPGRRFALPKAWMLGASVAAAAVMLFAGIPALLQPAEQAQTEQPIAGAPVPGSQLSQLTTTKLGSVEEAKSAFGDGLRVPGGAPAGFTLSEMTAVGEAGQPARDILFTYVSGEKTATFAATRMEASFPKEMFSKTEVGGAEAYVFEQPGLVELFWTLDGVQYSVVGAMTAEEATTFAETVQ